MEENSLMFLQSAQNINGTEYSLKYHVFARVLSCIAWKNTKENSWLNSQILSARQSEIGCQKTFNQTNIPIKTVIDELHYVFMWV